MQYELGIIGAGNMAEAIVRGVLKAGLFQPAQIIAADVAAPRRDLFEHDLNVRAIEDNSQVARNSRVLLLSVKPQMMAKALEKLGEVTDPESLIISIAAGIGSAFIEKHLGKGKTWRVIRTMPNTPMLVGEGMVGISRGKHATTEDMATARKIFESAATVVEVGEDKIDAITAMSGSGPAYFFYLVEQMIAAGTALGLTPAQSELLARRTALGRLAKMLTTSPDSPQELRRKVTSPGGTTHAAISCMEERGVGQAIVDAIKAAERRGKELGL